MDLHTMNQEFSDSRKLIDNQEVVQYGDNSSLKIWLNEKNINYSPHWHSALEIIMPVENYYDVYVNDIHYHIQPGEILAIPPGEIHELLAPSSGSRYIFLINISQISELKGFSGIQSLLVQPLYISKSTFPYIYDDLNRLLTEMHREYFSGGEYAELTIYSLLIQFFVKLGYNHLNTTDIFPNVRMYKQKEYIQKFNNLMSYIDLHYMEDLALEDVAASIGFSKFHFSRLFKQYTNFTFYDYLCYRRIKAAEELLAEPELSITEVALQTGFSSISTFNRLFKQQKNCTPSQYRAKNRLMRTH